MNQSIERNQAQAAADMRDHYKNAKRQVHPGDRGVDYFWGSVEVIEASARIISLRTTTGRIVRVFRDQWFGLRSTSTKEIP